MMHAERGDVPAGSDVAHSGRGEGCYAAVTCAERTQPREAT